MAGALVALSMIFLLFITGQLIECIKRILMFIVNCFLHLFDLLGINIFNKESKIKVSKDFKDTFQEIKIVKRSKQNIKLKPSINLFALITLILSIFLVIFDLDIVSGGAITTWLYTSTFFNKIIASQQSMNITYVSVLFSIISFSFSKLLNQWKETKEFRKARHEIKKKNQVFKTASSKELLDAAKVHDAERYEQLKKQE